MSEKRKNGRRGWNLLLAAHLFAYVIAWMIALILLSNLWTSYFRADELSFVTGVLLWLPVLALHVTTYVYTGRQRRVPPADERQAYREGFADAMRQLADRSYDERQTLEQRLALDDEGELVELPVQPSAGKRKRG